MINITVRLFASLRLNKEKELTLEVMKGSTIKDILKMLDISKKDATILMVNGRHKDYDTVLSDNDILSLFPPIGGG